MVVNTQVGRIVISKAGRDKGKSFIILKEVDGEFVLVCDGGLRGIQRPKRKRLKHLNFCEGVFNYQGEELTDDFIRKILRSYDVNKEV